MELAPLPIAEAFGPGAPTGPLVAITSGPSAVHRSWRLSTSRGRFAVKTFSRDQHAHGVAALEGPVHLELAALAAGVPLPRPCLAVETGAGIAEVAGLAAIHRLGVPCGEGAPVDRWYRTAHGAGHWQGLTARAERAGRGWAGRLRAALPLLAEVEALVAARAAEELAAAAVSWSSRAHGEPDDRVALALVEGYRWSIVIGGATSA
jgi:hypothetical protein